MISLYALTVSGRACRVKMEQSKMLHRVKLLITTLMDQREGENALFELDQSNQLIQMLCVEIKRSFDCLQQYLVKVIGTRE